MIRPLVRSILSSRFASLRVKHHILRISNEELRLRQFIKVVLIRNSINIITFKEIISIFPVIQVLSTTDTVSIKDFSGSFFRAYQFRNVIIYIPAINRVKSTVIFDESFNFVNRREGTKLLIKHRDIYSFIVYSIDTGFNTKVRYNLTQSSLNLFRLLVNRVVKINCVG